MFVLLHCVLCHRANVLLLVLLHCEDSPVRILPWIEPLPRESIDRDYDGHWLAQTLRARSSSLSAKRSSAYTGRLSEGRTSSGSAGLEWKLSLVPAQARAGASMFPFPGLRMFLAAVGANLPVSGSSHYFASVRFRFCCSFADHVAAPTDQTDGEVLEPAHF
jgi:hypothetical protein